MSVLTISAVSLPGQEAAEQQSQGQRELRPVPKPSAEASANTPRTQAQQGSEQVQNGIHVSASTNPQATLRVDLHGLQNALDAGDLPAAQVAFRRIEQDDQQIAKALQESAARAVSALPDPSGKQESAAAVAGSGQQSSVDVYA